MKTKRSSKKQAPSSAMEQAIAQVDAAVVERPKSEALKREPYTGKPFISGALGVALHYAHLEAVAALKAAGIKPVPEKDRVSTEPFTRDPQQRKYLASFVADADRREIIMPGPDFVSSFGSRAALAAPMSEETKAYLRERSAAKRMLRPKLAAGAYLIQQFCDDFNVPNPRACAVLRKAKTPKPDHGRWAWASKEEAVAVFTGAGLLDAQGKVIPAGAPVAKKSKVAKVAAPAAPAPKIEKKQARAASAKKVEQPRSSKRKGKK